jgi:hypothetical protein
MLVRFHGVSNGEEGVMGILMINCPSTGHAVSTGIEMSGVDQLPTVVATTKCSACGRVHEWSKDSAWLAEGGDQYRAVAGTPATHINGHPRGAH